MFEIAIDTGGTFTDGVLIDDERKISVAKFPTDVVDPEKSLMGCIELLARERGLTDQALLVGHNYDSDRVDDCYKLYRIKKRCKMLHDIYQRF